MLYKPEAVCMFPPFGLFTRSPVMPLCLEAGNHCESFVMFLIVTIRDFKSGPGRNSNVLHHVNTCCIKCWDVWGQAQVRDTRNIQDPLGRIIFDPPVAAKTNYHPRTLTTIISNSGSWILNAAVMVFLWCLLDDNSYHYNHPWNDTYKACQNVQVHT